MTTHLENVYRLSCELRLEFQKAIDEGISFAQFGKADKTLNFIKDWALANLYNESRALDTEESNKKR